MDVLIKINVEKTNTFILLKMLIMIIKKEKELYQKINLKEKNKIVELVEHIRNLLTILKKTILIIM